jgi:hypothetical protein
LRFAIAITSLALLCGCGTPGSPQPPSLELPQPVTDLTTERRGDRVKLTWSVPLVTTDRQRVRHIGQTRICRTTRPQMPAAGALPADTLMTACTNVATVTPQDQKGPRGRPQAAYTDTLPQEFSTQQPLGAAVYAIEVLNDRGRGAGLSNQVPVPLAPALAPPERVESQVTAQGVLLTWRGERERNDAGLAFAYRVSRTEVAAPRADGAPAANDLGAVQLTPDGAYTFIDRNAEWEKQYTYTVSGDTVLAGTTPAVTVAGAASPPANVNVHDVFPPAVPSGVQAVFTEANGQRFIDLTWTPNQDADLAGYNLYRREEGGTPQKVNAELLRAPSTRDANLTAGRQYFYSVSAVDLRGNASQRSPETSERVPQ